jgi:hypothetical protein
MPSLSPRARFVGHGSPVAVDADDVVADAAVVGRGVVDHHGVVAHVGRAPSVAVRGREDGLDMRTGVKGGEGGEGYDVDRLSKGCWSSVTDVETDGDERWCVFVYVYVYVTWVALAAAVAMYKSASPASTLRATVTRASGAAWKKA